MTSSYLLKLTGLSILIFTLSLSCLRAQNIRGTVWDENHNGLSYATVRLLHPDSTFVAGVCTDSVGHYQIKASYTGNYLLGISSLDLRRNSFLFMFCRMGFVWNLLPWMLKL